MIEDQAEDGGWVTGYGDPHHVWGTIAAMYLLRVVSQSDTTV